MHKLRHAQMVLLVLGASIGYRIQIRNSRLNWTSPKTITVIFGVSWPYSAHVDEALFSCPNGFSFLTSNNKKVYVTTAERQTGNISFQLESKYVDVEVAYLIHVTNS